MFGGVGRFKVFVVRIVKYFDELGALRSLL